MSKRVAIYAAEDCRTLYAQGEPHSNDRPNGWQDMADRLNRIASERIVEYICGIYEITRGNRNEDDNQSGSGIFRCEFLSGYGQNGGGYCT